MDILNKLPLLPEGGESPYDCGDGAWLFLFKNKTKKDMESYADSAREYGYKEFDSTHFGDNY